MRERGSEMTNSDRSKTFYDKFVSKWSASVFCECRVETASHREADCLSSRCVITQRIHPRSVPSLIVSSYHLSWYAKQTDLARHWFLAPYSHFFCALRHPLIALIPIWHQIIDTARLLANSGVFHSTLDLKSLCLPRSPSLRRFSLELSACRAPVSRRLHHGTLHLSHMHPHTV